MTTKRTKRKLTAILSADVEGYSRLMSQDEVGTIRTLTTYREAMGTLIHQYKGRVIDAPGDNLLAEFASVVDAVNCAVEIQRELAERNAELPAMRQMEFRIGVNLGDVVEEKGRIYGDGVNIAARVESLAEAGGICISGTAYDHVKSKLGLEYEYLGEQTVKNIPEPVGVYKVLSFPGAAAYRVVKAKGAVARKWRKAALVISALLLIGLGAMAIWNFYLRPPPALELPDKPSIAVLPFTNISGDPEQEYFVDGMTDDLITDLSKISGLFVIARNSVFTYKGKPVKVDQISRELGVRYLLEGSVRKAADHVRINAQLIDGATGGHLWAERYDGQIGDIFALQDRITQKIVSALAVKLTTDEQAQFGREETKNMAAYDAFLRGWEHYLRFTPDDFAKALSYFKKAIELDLNYARAYAAVAMTYWRGTIWNMLPSVSWNVGRLRAVHYLEMVEDKPISIVHQLASSMLIFLRQHEEAIAEAELAIALDPNDPTAHYVMAAVLAFAGRPEEAADFAKRSMPLDPHNPALSLFWLGFAQICMGQFKEAVSLIENALEINPHITVWNLELAVAYAHLGREKEARAAMDKFLEIAPKENLRNIMYSFPFKDLEDADLFAEGFLKAGLPGQPGGYYKISEENKLSGEEMRALVLGRTHTVVVLYSGERFWIDYSKDGRCTIRGPWGRDRGMAWNDGDMWCIRWDTFDEGLKNCTYQYRNPEGSPETKDEYISLSYIGMYPWSPVD